jgi:hypothetical protein
MRELYNSYVKRYQYYIIDNCVTKKCPGYSISGHNFRLIKVQTTYFTLLYIDSPAFVPSALKLVQIIFTGVSNTFSTLYKTVPGLKF